MVDRMKMNEGKYYKYKKHYYKILDENKILHVSDASINHIPIDVFKVILTKNAEVEIDKDEFQEAVLNTIFELGIYEYAKPKE